MANDSTQEQVLEAARSLGPEFTREDDEGQRYFAVAAK